MPTKKKISLQIENIFKYIRQILYHCGIEYHYCTNGTIKAHKPEKNYPLRNIVLIIGTPAYGKSKYLFEIIQPTLNKNNKIQNSTLFEHERKDWQIEPTETQVSLDVVNLYPSVLLDRSVQVIVEFLQDDSAELKKRTKLNLTNNQQLLDFV